MKNILSNVILILMSCTTVFSQSLEGIKNIVNKNSGLCLAVNNASTMRGEEATQWACDGNADKNWEFIYLGGNVYRIQNMNSKLYLAVRDRYSIEGGRIVQREEDVLDQLTNWQLIDIGNGYYKIKNLISGLFLAVGGGSQSNGGNVIQWQDNGQEDVKWQIVPNQKSSAKMAKSKKDIGVKSDNVQQVQIQQPIQNVQTPQPVQKTMTLTFNGIFMGECGNANNCHHEPVAGKVEAYIVHRPSGNRIYNVNQTTLLWQNSNRSLVCNNYPQSSGNDDNRGSGMGDRLDYSSKPTANNINRRFNYMVDDLSYKRGEYDLVVKFNLGVVHKDNDFAGAGGHWLTSGDNLITDRIKLLPPPNNLRTVGSFQTTSNRCHEFWLQFQSILNE